MASEKIVEQLIAEIDTKIIKADTIRCEVGTPCLICGESVPVIDRVYYPKICEKCKAAVMKVREQDGK